MSISYVVRQVGEVTILDLSGRISQGESPAPGQGGSPMLHDVVRDQVATGRQKILLNLREVSYMDSSGIGELVACSTTLRNQGGQLRICSATARIQDLLRITRLESTLNPDKDETAALQAFASYPQKSTLAV